MFFKIENWNFQHLFEIKFRETSQNFNSFSLFWQLLIFIFFSIGFDWVEILWGFMKFFFKQILKVSAFYLIKTKKGLLLKKSLSHCWYQNKKALFTNPIFSEGFGFRKQAQDPQFSVTLGPCPDTSLVHRQSLTQNLNCIGHFTRYSSRSFYSKITIG